MSTYWGFRCETCNVATPHWFNHGEDLLRSFWRYRAALIPAYRCLNQSDAPWALELNYMGVYDDPAPLAFLSEHEGHTIVLLNEYGDTEPVDAVPAEEAQ